MILIKQGLLEPVAQDHVQMASEYLKDRLSISAWWPLQKNTAVPDVQMEPPRFQLMPTASVLVTRHWLKSLSLLYTIPSDIETL